ncbi:glycosyltransferase [Pontibacter oryzae]|uniref:Glycosyltransferase n=1 Tax=Pontibacter oryzae TaxID=2304593 RepID=A0A399RUM4_9BACT|nr:glycosyltransferase [Pontibacter oryzae]RIJ34023.1 glycosyltransferase [Pontibacter oryzae]
MDNFLSNRIAKTNYYYSEEAHHLFQVQKLNKSNFAENGKNLTISLLSLNRVKLTIKLLLSIEYYFPNYQGEVLIIDNGSAVDQITQLIEFSKTSSLKINIKELGENHGVGRARNIAAQEISTDWIMFIDNDMYFINNPLPAIKSAIELLGCNFLNLPLINYDNKTVFALGGALFPTSLADGYFIGGGSSFNFRQEKEADQINLQAPFLSDFLFGGASVVNRHAFNQMGGFDYDMFVGFEDIDFSLRLYNSGIKIGNIHKFTLIHNHKPPVNENDLIAEKKRFSNSVIKQSANAFKQKNGLIVYDSNTEEWLRERENELNITSSQLIQNREEKPKVALVVDAQNWAFHNIAKNIVKELSAKYDFEILFQSSYLGEDWLNLYLDIYNAKPEVILFFWRPAVNHMFGEALHYELQHKFNIDPNAFCEFLNKTTILTGVYDHLFLDDQSIEANNPLYRHHIDGYFVSSNLLRQIYETIDGYPSPYSVIQDGVDTSIFYPNNSKTPSTSNQPLVIGWAGNSKWGMEKDGVDHKGLISIIKPAVLELIEEGYSINLIYADKQEPDTQIPMAQMNQFYNKLDVYVCTSDIEGTPNPVLESMACGIAVVSTDVGIVSEIFGKKQREFILHERTKEALKIKIKEILQDRSILRELGNENLTRIKHWTWEDKCERFDEMFSYYLFKKKAKLSSLKSFPYSAIDKSVVRQEPVSQGEALPILEEHTHGLEYGKLPNQLANNFIEIKEWYHKEYEVLPIWYKRIGHVIKAFQGNRSFKSLLKKTEKI